MSFATGSSIVLGSTRGSPGETPEITGHLDGTHILVPLLTPEVPAVTDQLRLAAALARTTDASLHVLNPIRVPEQTPRDQQYEVATDDEEALLEWALEQVASATTDVDGGFLFTRKLVNGLRRTIATNDIDTLVVPGSSKGSLLRRSLMDRLALQAECDVITVNGQRGFEQTPSILLPVADGPHSGVATDIAQRLATDADAWIDILHVIDEGASSTQRERAQAVVDATYQRIARPATTTTRILEADDVAEAIIEQSAYYELTVIGAPTKGRLRQFVFGSTNQTIRNNARSVVLSARSTD